MKKTEKEKGKRSQQAMLFYFYLGQFAASSASGGVPRAGCIEHVWLGVVLWFSVCWCQKWNLTLLVQAGISKTRAPVFYLYISGSINITDVKPDINYFLFVKKIGACPTAQPVYPVLWQSHTDQKIPCPFPWASLKETVRVPRYTADVSALG